MDGESFGVDDWREGAVADACAYGYGVRVGIEFDGIQMSE